MGKGAEMFEQEQAKILNSELNVVYKYLRKRGISHVDAQDIVQETAFKFLSYSDSIKSQNIRGWLIRVALNFHHDQYRKNKRIKIGFNDEHLKLLSKDLPEELLLGIEKKEEIQATLARLNPQYKELLLLKYYWDLKYKDISVLLDMKIDTVKTNLYRARNQFIKFYKEVKE